MIEDPISTSEAAELKGVHRDTVWRWITNGWLIAEKSVPSVARSPWLLSRAEVLAFVPPRPGWRKGVGRCSICGEVLTEGHACRPEQMERWRSGVQKRLQTLRDRESPRNPQDEELTE